MLSVVIVPHSGTEYSSGTDAGVDACRASAAWHYVFGSVDHLVIVFQIKRTVN